MRHSNKTLNNQSFTCDPLTAQMNLPQSESLVWTVLWTFQGSNDYAFPSLAAISERLGGMLKPKRISQIIQKLKKKGWLEAKKVGYRGTNHYRVMIPEDLLFVPNFAKREKNKKLGKPRKTKMDFVLPKVQIVHVPERRIPTDEEVWALSKEVLFDFYDELEKKEASAA